MLGQIILLLSDSFHKKNSISVSWSIFTPSVCSQRIKLGLLNENDKIQARLFYWTISIVMAIPWHMDSSYRVPLQFPIKSAC